jgi:hypothetical protein
MLPGVGTSHHVLVLTTSEVRTSLRYYSEVFVELLDRCIR